MTWPIGAEPTFGMMNWAVHSCHIKCPHERSRRESQHIGSWPHRRHCHLLRRPIKGPARAAADDARRLEVAVDERGWLQLTFYALRQRQCPLESRLAPCALLQHQRRIEHPVDIFGLLQPPVTGGGVEIVNCPLWAVHQVQSHTEDSLDAFVALDVLPCSRSPWRGHSRQDRRKTCVRLIVFGRSPLRR